jgi:hypothetical protein
MNTIFKAFPSVDVSDLNFAKYVGIKTWMVNTPFDKISACKIVFIYKIVIVVIRFCEQ